MGNIFPRREMHVCFHGFQLIFLPPHCVFAHETRGHVVVKNTDIATNLTPPLTGCEFLGKWPPVYIGFLICRMEIQQALWGLKEPISIKHSESCLEQTIPWERQLCCLSLAAVAPHSSQGASPPAETQPGISGQGQTPECADAQLSDRGRLMTTHARRCLPSSLQLLPSLYAQPPFR